MAMPALGAVLGAYRPQLGWQRTPKSSPERGGLSKAGSEILNSSATSENFEQVEHAARPASLADARIRFARDQGVFAGERHGFA